MFELRSSELTVTVLDPVADRERLGPRYCTGGYIFQIEDGTHTLLSGPTFPDEFDVISGQGIPDSFAESPLPEVALPLRGSPTAQNSDAETAKLVPGVGLCDLAARRVIEFCSWTVDTSPETIRFETSHRWRNYAFNISRVVSVAGRVVRSRTRIDNREGRPVPIRWFPHPFYPVERSPSAPLCSFPPSSHATTTVEPGSPYFVGEDGYLRCSDLSLKKVAAVECESAGPFTILQHHPVTGMAAARFSYAPNYVKVWGNSNTFSFEPYFERTVGSNMSLAWLCEYHF